LSSPIFRRHPEHPSWIGGFRAGCGWDSNVAEDTTLCLSWELGAFGRNVTEGYSTTSAKTAVAVTDAIHEEVDRCQAGYSHLAALWASSASA